MLRRIKQLVKLWLVYLEYCFTRTNRKPTDGAKHLLFVGHDMKFVQPVIKWLEESDKWRVRTLDMLPFRIEPTVELLQARDWADVVFCEWGLANAVWFSRHLRKRQSLIVRLHRQEFNAPELKQISISSVDSWLSIAPEWQRRFSQLLNVPNEKMQLIYNPISRESVIEVDASIRNNRIGLVGCVPQMKRFDIALDILDSLYNENKSFELHIKGLLPFSYPWMFDDNWIHESDYYQQCFTRIQNAPWRNNVIFDGHGDDMAEWYSSMGWILSTSDFEGSHQAVAEGMMYGCIPVIRNWDGASDLYLTEPIFSEVSDMVRYILDGRSEEAISRVRDFAQANFEAGHVAGQIENLINEAWSAKHGKS